MVESAQLIGRWAIAAWEQRYDDGRCIFPLGQALNGFICYSEDGTMACMIANRERPRMSGAQFTSPDEEKVRAYEGFFAYSGTFTIEGDVVNHHVELSLFPNWEGGVQQRRVTIDGDYLAITARLEEGTPEARTALLGWNRIIS